MDKYYLREICNADVPFINEWRNDRNLIDALCSPFRYISQEVDQLWFNSYLANRSNTVRLAICEKGSGLLVGAVYLLSIDWISRSCEFAIWIGDKNHQGVGAGRFAARRASLHAFQDLNLNRIFLTVLKSNARAMALYTSLGFVVEGTLRQAVFKNGSYADVVQMSVLADEFISVN